MFKSDAVGEGEWAAARADQRGEVGTAAEPLAKIVGEGADVGTFATDDGEGEARIVPGEYFKGSDGDGTRGQGEFLARASSFIGGLPLDFGS